MQGGAPPGRADCTHSCSAAWLNHHYPGTAVLQVYNAYYHGFATLKELPPVADMQQNEQLVRLLRRLVDEHCE